MRFFASASALLAMTVAAVAQTADFNPIYSPSSNEEIAAGSTFEITWSAPAKYADGTVSISLIGGATQGTQIPLSTIATGVPNSDEKFSWTVDASLGADAVYGLVIKFESNPEIFQYSNPFHIKAEESTGGETTVVTTHAGVKTVTLTSCPPEESTTTSVGTTVTPDTTVTVPIVTPTEIPTTTLITTTKFDNTTSIVIPTPPTTLLPPPVPTTEVPPPPPATTTPPVQVPPESGAARVGSALFAVVGGVAAVLLL